MKTFKLVKYVIKINFKKLNKFTIVITNFICFVFFKRKRLCLETKMLTD